MTMRTSILAGLTVLLSGVVTADSNVPWAYSGKHGPTHRADLSSAYAACNGMNQSPINLSRFIEADLRPIGFSYRLGSNQILNNGHTVPANYASGSAISVDTVRYSGAIKHPRRSRY